MLNERGPNIGGGSVIEEFSSIFQGISVSSNSDQVPLSFHILPIPLNYGVINVTYVLIVFSNKMNIIELKPSHNVYVYAPIEIYF